MIIDFGLISEKHTGKNIVNGFFEVLKDYKIASKVFIIIRIQIYNNNYYLKNYLKIYLLFFNSFLLLL